MSLIVCPVCGKSGFVPDRDPNTYEVVCPDCREPDEDET